MLSKIIIKLLIISFLILIIFNFIYNIYNKRILLYNKNSKSGSYIRIFGDRKQPKYFKRYDNIIEYYDDNKNIINYSNSYCSNQSNKCIYKHNFKKSISIFNIVSCTGSGFAQEKHERYNVSYKSFHKYYRIGKIKYYYNIYHFSDNSISSAIYQKIE